MNRILQLLLIINLAALSACRTNPPAQAEAPKAIEKGDLASYFHYEPGRETLISAHRGGKGLAGYPENCLETMQHVQQQIPNAIFEVDIAQTSDGVLVLMHDNSLERTTTGSGPIVDRTFADLQGLYLEDDEGQQTSFRIPTLEKVLQWADDKQVILMLDIKRSVDYEDVLAYVEEADALDNSVIITYSVGAAQKLHRLNSELMLSVSIRNFDELKRMEESGIPEDRWVAFTGTKASPPALFAALHEKGVMCILGSLGNIDRQAKARGPKVYQDFVAQGIDIFATDRPLACYEAVK
ncbi:MAG: glycerophosphodiester phosphodiesterase family protein [Bacteroidota bacterium]